MIVQHKKLAAGRWEEFRLIEQMAHARKRDRAGIELESEE